MICAAVCPYRGEAGDNRATLSSTNSRQGRACLQDRLWPGRHQTCNLHLEKVQEIEQTYRRDITLRWRHNENAFVLENGDRS